MVQRHPAFVERIYMPARSSSTKGFKQAASLITKRVKEASETRGFAQSRLLTHWEEVAGKDTAKIAQPDKVTYKKKGLGASVVLICNGANTVVEMEKENIRAQVNSVYGYNAITEIKITQTAATGFAEAQAVFDGPQKPAGSSPNPNISRAAQEMAASVNDPEFSRALAALAQNVLSKQKT